VTRLAPLLLLLAGCAPAVGASHGRGGIVSTNPCADALLVGLVEPDRIAAISHYSHDPGATSLPLAVARRFRATAGTAEEVIALRPPLVIASSFTPASTRAAYARAGLRTLYLDSPTTVAASVVQVREVAKRVGHADRGEAMVGQILQDLSPPPRRRGSSCGAFAGRSNRASPGCADTGPPPSRGWTQAARPAALLYIAGDLANGSGTLLDELTRVAGFRNAAADYGLAHTGTLPAELLVARPPDVIIAAGEGRGAALRRRLLPTTPQFSFDRRLVNCGGPTIPAALARLRAIRASL
jgi:iron complex transport system substrate-binding protein